MLDKSKIKMGSNRSLGIVFFLVFLIVGFWPLLNEGQIRVWSIIISVIFLFLGVMNSKLLTPLNRLWTKLGLLLGSIAAPIIMGAIFFLVVTPIALIMKIIGKDSLYRKYDKHSKSYWIKRKKEMGTMKQQF